ncbi:glycogen debranching enzyme GlgX [Burkholderia lata]|uniref:Glycogen debranching enzyme GlgX n=1 Tax=Burkholderia lata (strain ATCC 17760 / DSM 23089 / LMG 22485 / NCIMB 9086 / R18194 / 383) TaxID=482957 RepID=A0A6P2SPG0_BURL3|nr:glycogen debranching protein GlgX [Burkholderia lata]VWC47533.1 glycogen debranching enzyme GlgX [Burkholderia lata]
MTNVTFHELLAGKPYPLGANWDGLGTNFAVFSRHASGIDLCLFDASGRREIARMPLQECTHHVWHGYLPEAHPGLLYGFRAHGPYDPRNGHYFNPHKLLLDPYAKRLFGTVRWADALYAYRIGSPRSTHALDRRDSALAMPKAIVSDDAFGWGDDRRPDVPWHRTIIYEVHVRGFSQLRTDLHPSERGTFAALASPRTIEHLHRLGVTTLELLPIQAFVQDRAIVERGLTNYWGYSPLLYFAPEPRYLGNGGPDEIRRAVRRLHRAGIEVVLDVVYNHTGEGDGLGPSLSLRGLDNASYYVMTDDGERRYVDDTGCGNTLNIAHPRVMQLVLDSLRYWAESFHVDGFRFDLCTTLGREDRRFDVGAAFFDAIQQDPVLGRLKLIAEPWDLGPHGYQLGNHPAAFAEWNDRFRDSTRRFWRGDAGERPEFARRMCGSADLFDRDGRRPWASIQYVAAHDGFTLHDLTSYAHKHNEANGEDNRDGADVNFSANWGAEGPTSDSRTVDIRERVKRAMLCTLYLSNGTPMLQAGDEWGNSQSGNNNAYCQDNEVAWLDWSVCDAPNGTMLLALCARLARLRHGYRVFQQPYFPHGRNEWLPGIRDVDWFDANGEAMSAASWENADIRTLAVRRAAPARPDRRLGAQPGPAVDVALLLINGGPEEQLFVLAAPELPWRIVIDSAHPTAPESHAPEHGAIAVGARSIVVLMAAAVPTNVR